MELKVKTPTFPEVISFNYEELKQEITAKTSDYLNLVYTDDQIQLAKKDRATLNKFVKALSDERIKIKKECLKPYEDFEAKIKELDAIVSKAIKNIDDQVKAAEEQKKAEKFKQIKKYWFDLLEANKIPEGICFKHLFEEKMLNASVTIPAACKEMDSKLAQIEQDLATLRNLPEFAFEAVDVYLNTLNLSMAVNEAHWLSEQAKRKAEYEAEQERRKAEAEAKKQEEQLPGQIGFTDAKSFEECMKPLVEELPTEPLKETAEWISFRALLTTDDALALKAFFNSRNIEFEAI